MTFYVNQSPAVRQVAFDALAKLFTGNVWVDFQMTVRIVDEWETGMWWWKKHHSNSYLAVRKYHMHEVCPIRTDDSIVLVPDAFETPVAGSFEGCNVYQ